MFDTKAKELCNKIMYEFWYDCVKPKYGGKTENIYVDIAKDAEKRFDISKCELDKSLSK